MSPPGKEQRPGQATQAAAKNNIDHDDDKPTLASTTPLAAAQRGMCVFPLKPKTKDGHLVDSWPKWSTTDVETIVAEFSGRELNYGVDCGKSGLVVIDEDEPGEFERWAVDHGYTIPSTFTVKTAHGRHWYFHADGTITGNRDAAFRGYRINVRGAGGYVLGPGSTHPTGAAYTAGNDLDPAPLPTWLTDALTGTTGPFATISPPFELPDVITSSAVHGPPTRDEVLYKYACSLRGKGVTVTRAVLAMQEAWKRCEQPPEHPYPLKKALEKIDRAWGYDYTSPNGAADFLPVPVPPHIGEERGTPLYVDVGALLDGGLPEPPAPAFLHRDDGRALLYAGQVNVLFGDPESGKTWVAIAAVAEALQDGGRALFLDLDHNGWEAVIARLLAFGVRPDVLRDTGAFRLAEPEDGEHLRRIIADARRWRPAVAVVDSVGELLPMLGLSSNSPDDLTAGHAQVLKPLAVAGACVIAIDHLPKNAENKANGQTGTAAKRRVVGGVSLRVTVKDAFTPGHGGSCSLKVNKDRHGGLRAHCPRAGGEASAGTFTLSEAAGGLRWQITAPGDHVEPDADAIALRQLKPPPQSVRDIKARMGWGTDRAAAALSAFRAAYLVPTPVEEVQVHPEGKDSVPVPAERPGTPEHSPTRPGRTGEPSQDLAWIDGVADYLDGGAA